MFFASGIASVRTTARTFLKSGVGMLALGQGGAWATDAPQDNSDRLEEAEDVDIKNRHQEQCLDKKYLQMLTEESI